jgi:hypothetical protein
VATPTMSSDVDDLETVHQMNGDIFDLGGIYQKHSFDVGAPPIVEGMWASA